VLRRLPGAASGTANNFGGYSKFLIEVAFGFRQSLFANGDNSIPLEFEGKGGVSQEIGTSGLGRLSLRNQNHLKQIPYI